MAIWMLIVFLSQSNYGSQTPYNQSVVVRGFVNLEGCQKAYKAMQEVAPGVYIKGKCVEVPHRG